MSSVPAIVLVPGASWPEEAEAEGVAMLLAVGAANPDRVTVQRAGQVSRDEVALMRAVNSRPCCRKWNTWVETPAANSMRTSHWPVGSRTGAATGATLSRWGSADNSAWSRSATIFSSPGDNMYGVIDTPVRDGSAGAARGTARFVDRCRAGCGPVLRRRCRIADAATTLAATAYGWRGRPAAPSTW